MPHFTGKLSKEAFRDRLMWSLSHWKANEYKGVFLKVPTKNADWMPVVVEVTCFLNWS